MLRLAIVLVFGLGLSVDHVRADMLAEAQRAVSAYADPGALRRDGWRRFGGVAPLMGQHYFHPKRPDPVSGQPLRPERPSNLLFAEIGGRQLLVGAAYNYRLAEGEPLPQGFPGQRDIWHVHDIGRFVAAVTQDRPLMRLAARTFVAPAFEDADGVERDRLAMVHIWLIPSPDGPFVSHNRALAYLQLGLPASWAEGASMDAALGLALATPGGCKAEINASAWMGNVSRRNVRRLHRACDQAAEYVRARLGSRDAANAAGEAAWRTFRVEWMARTTPEQRARMAAIVEPGPGVMHHR